MPWSGMIFQNFSENPAGVRRAEYFFLIQSDDRQGIKNIFE